MQGMIITSTALSVSAVMQGPNSSSEVLAEQSRKRAIVTFIRSSSLFVRTTQLWIHNILVGIWERRQSEHNKLSLCLCVSVGLLSFTIFLELLTER